MRFAPFCGGLPNLMPEKSPRFSREWLEGALRLAHQDQASLPMFPTRRRLADALTKERKRAEHMAMFIRNIVPTLLKEGAYDD